MPGQAFCGNDDCNVLTWNPTNTAEENLGNAGFVAIEGDMPKAEGGKA
jgi:hypothetical protein